MEGQMNTKTEGNDKSSFIWMWGVMGLIVGCILVKSDQYIYPQILHWDDRKMCKESADSINLEYSYSAYKDSCKVRYKDSWMSFSYWNNTYSPEAVALQERLSQAIIKNIEIKIEKLHKIEKGEGDEK
jgi:hypothetical protein